jgi:AraC-like DNA-binding protein
MPLAKSRPRKTRPFRAASSSSRQPRRRRFTHAHRQRLQRAIQHYLEGCYQRVTAARVSECAESLELTLPYLSRIAPGILGMSLLRYMRQHQVAHAVELLLGGPLQAEEIALRAGFGSVPTFYKWFHAVHGMTPGEFREVKK